MDTHILVLEGADGGDEAGAPRAGDAQGHNAREQELAEEDEEEEHEVEAGVVAEGLVGGAEPAEEGEGDEKESIDESETEHAALVLAREEEAEAAEEVEDHEQGVEEPEVVEPLDHLLELHGDVHVDVLVEAGLAGHEARHGRPVVHPAGTGSHALPSWPP